MTEISNTGRNDFALHPSGVDASAANVMAWFVREVLPLEAILTHFLRQNWRNTSEVEDLRQEVYLRICEAARKELPDITKPFVLATARNLLIDRVRKEQIIPIEAVADFDEMKISTEGSGPERTAIARDELRKLQIAMESLPPRCREVIVLGRVEGLTGQEIAARLGITHQTVSEHLRSGIKALAEMLHAEPATQRRKL